MRLPPVSWAKSTLPLLEVTLANGRMLPAKALGPVTALRKVAPGAAVNLTWLLAASKLAPRATKFSVAPAARAARLAKVKRAVDPAPGPLAMMMVEVPAPRDNAPTVSEEGAAPLP